MPVLWEYFSLLCDQITKGGGGIIIIIIIIIIINTVTKK